MSPVDNQSPVLRPCGAEDAPVMHAVILNASEAYRGKIPADCWHEPYMSLEELHREITAGVRFTGATVDGSLAGVMGLQQVKDVSLIRHACVRTGQQGRGAGGQLLRELMDGADRTTLVGTWTDATWAIRFYERYGFGLTSAEETERLLTTCWTVPARQRQVSVVLRWEGHS